MKQETCENILSQTEHYELDYKKELQDTIILKISVSKVIYLIEFSDSELSEDCWDMMASGVVDSGIGRGDEKGPNGNGRPLEQCESQALARGPNRGHTADLHAGVWDDPYAENAAGEEKLIDCGAH